MKVELIENNNSSTSAHHVLRKGLRNSNEVSIAVAYITNEGLAAIYDDLHQASYRKDSKQIRFLTGLSHDGFNDPDALRKLLNLSKDPNSKFEFGLSALKSKFHQKTYIFVGKKTSSIMLGSSNLTLKALSGEGELNQLNTLTNSEDKEFINRVRGNFAQNWENSCRNEKRLQQIIELYKKSRSKRPTSSVSSREWNNIASLIGKSKSKKKFLSPSDGAKQPRVHGWYSYVSGELSKESYDAITLQNSVWAKRSYWVEDLSRQEYMKMTELLGQGVKCLFFEHEKSKPRFLTQYRLVAVDKLAQPVNQKEGSYFAALSGGRKRVVFSKLKNTMRGRKFSFYQDRSLSSTLLGEILKLY